MEFHSNIVDYQKCKNNLCDLELSDKQDTNVTRFIVCL